MAEQTGDFFAPMEGKSKTSLIQVKTDTSKGKGQKITFTNQSGFYNEGKMGDELFEVPTDFEEILQDSYDLNVDYLRNAASINDRAEEKMGMRGEIRGGIPTQLGLWAGRTKSHRIFMMLREKLQSENFVFAGDKTEDTLGTNDTLSYNSIVNMGTQLKPLGGLPAHVGKVGKNAVYRYCITPTVDALGSLKLDSDYRSLLTDAGERGKMNCIFNGGYADIDGHIIKEYNPIDHDGEGAIGSPLNPQAHLGVAIAADATGLVVKGGGYASAAAKTHKMYFKDFRGYAYRFLPDDVLSPASEERYFLIVNPSTAATAPGKVGMYAYTTGNNGNQITVTKSLGSSTGRIATIGDVTYNAGDWVGYHTEVHPEGALIIPCNKKGVPIGWTPMLGQRFAYRGYGKWRNKRGVQNQEAGFVKQTFFVTVFGQVLRQDRRGRHNGALMQCHAIKPRGVKLPVIT